MKKLEKGNDGLYAWQRVWKHVKVDYVPNAATKFLLALEETGRNMYPLAWSVFDSPTFTMPQTVGDFPLVNFSLEDFGWKRPYHKVSETSLGLGLKLCPLGVVLTHALQYHDQPKGETIIYGMEPLHHPKGYPIVFALMHHPRLGKLFTSVHACSDDWRVNKNTRIIFQYSPEVLKWKDKWVYLEK